MSERDDNSRADDVGCALIIVMLVLIAVIITLDMINTGELRDLQRRVATLEQQR